MNCSRQLLDEIISVYRKSIIQSEAEVSTKLLVPLINWLGFSSELMSQEFPVYGWAGRSQAPAKNADFLLFMSHEFAMHRNRKPEDLEWVYQNSLLVIEAKKPGEMGTDVTGQARYYTNWTKSVAYIVSDDEVIKGYLNKYRTKDQCLLDCRIDELAEHIERLKDFSYEAVLKIKQQELNESGPQNIRLDNGTVIKVVTKESIGFLGDDFQLPYDKRKMYLEAVKPSDPTEITDKELLKRFMTVTDAFLDADSRYDIPKYMYGIPRLSVDASILINKNVMPIFKGIVKVYYWNDYETYIFRNEYIDLFVEYKGKRIKDFWFGYHVHDNTVYERIVHLNMVKSIFDASEIKICFNDRVISIKSSIKIVKQHNLETGELVSFFIDEMKKMKAIEDCYGISFALSVVNGMENINELNNSVDFVYDGIEGNANCEKLFRGGTLEEDVVISEPIFLEEGDIPLPIRKIYQYEFKPSITMLLPGVIKLKNSKTDEILRADCCCGYDLVKYKGK